MKTGKYILLFAMLLLPAIANAATYDAATVLQHSTNSDCWVIVQGKVYDLTQVVQWHANVIQCGKDNTALYLGQHMTLSNINQYYIGDLSVAPAACTYTYSSWGTCLENNTQNRAVVSISPANCAGTPKLTQSCVYVPPPSTCIYTYSNWSSCMSNNTQKRTVLTSSPANCIGSPALAQACVYVQPPQVNNTPPVVNNTPPHNTTPPSANNTERHRRYSVAQLLKHSTSNSCWVAVFGKVYDVTPVIPIYSSFFKCGADNTAKWQGSIFGNDTSIMAPFYIGDLALKDKETPPREKDRKDHGEHEDDDGSDEHEEPEKSEDHYRYTLYRDEGREHEDED